MNKISMGIGIFFSILVLFIFKSWILPGTLVAGDMPYFFTPLLAHVSFLSSWDSLGIGMGQSMLPALWLQLYTTSTMKLFGSLGWDIYVRIVWLFPYLLISFASSYCLCRKYFPLTTLGSILLSSFLYVCNTYALLLVGGGQMGIALSYGLAPFSLFAYENFLAKPSLRNSIVFSLLYALVILLDIRIGYIMMIVFAIRFIFALAHFTKKTLAIFSFYSILCGCIILLLHAFWLLPTLLTRGESINQFGEIYTSAGAVQFFSFAKFENAFGFLHPNWPENIFGLTHFMRPEFLLLPILAFGSLLCIPKDKREKTTILFLTLLAIVGTFLAKGANEPFGSVYIWLFIHVPGFIMFRDPTKWYLMIAISYAMLVPYTIGKMYIFLQGKQNIFLVLVLGYLLFLIHPALFDQLGGTFKTTSVPVEYVHLEKYLQSQPTFSRTLWIPTTQEFSYRDENHPAVSAQDFFHVASLSGVLALLKTQSTQLQQASIGYLVEPLDSQKTIFVSDRKYNKHLYEETYAFLKKISWLKEIPGFGGVHIFAIRSTKDHFWLSGQGYSTYRSISPTQYVVQVFQVTKGEKIIFTDSYDPFWTLHVDKEIVRASMFDKRLNSFALQKSGSYTITISYEPQKWVTIGLWVSSIVLLFTLVLLYVAKT